MSLPTSSHPSAPSWVLSDLHLLDTKGLLRKRPSVSSRIPGSLCLTTGSFLDFTSNDYLGLAHHPACVEAAQRAARDHGCGSGASRIVTGDSSLHRQLEETLATWLGTPSALLFPSGYQANLGLITALLRPDDLVFSDAQNHASLVDGCRLARARVVIYPHLDSHSLADALAAAPPGPRRVVITESLFSMDGSMAPLAAIRETCNQHDAILVVDEAHAMGVLGPKGSGLCAAQRIHPDLLVGTFSKALGSHGAFVCADDPWTALLCNRARSLIYSTALPAPAVAAALEAISLQCQPEGASLRTRLLECSHLLHGLLRDQGILCSGEGTPIASIPFRSSRGATRAKEHLQDNGLLAWAFRPPSVPASTSRLRISLSAAHRDEHIRTLASLLPSAVSNSRMADAGDLAP